MSICSRSSFKTNVLGINAVVFHQHDGRISHRLTQTSGKAGSVSSPSLNSMLKEVFSRISDTFLRSNLNSQQAFEELSKTICTQSQGQYKAFTALVSSSVGTVFNYALYLIKGTPILAELRATDNLSR